MAPKQAVLLIHGIGEQRPMDTLRGFIHAVWTTDKSVQHEHATAGIWSKPDTVSGNYELRRLTTSKNKHDVQTDFFEFYWAHLMEGTMVSHVVAWAKCILLRWPWKVPPALRGAWFVLVALAVVIGFFLIQTALPESWRVLELPKWLTGLLGAVVTLVAIPALKNIIGDAARYLDPAPGNIKRRQEIRVKGAKLLQALHEKGYRRIIVVGHSLGSVIGYDILTHAWPRYNKTGDLEKDHPCMTALEEMVASGDYSTEDYQEKQSEVFAEMAQNGYEWRVTDFLTLGSPLAHASILLAADGDDLREKQRSREYPTCPPELEKEKFSYPANRAHRKPHHAAVFAPTRWTNLYFPSHGVIWGDLIGGPVGSLFGKGVRDVAVKTGLSGGMASHTLYWTPGKGGEALSHILALREALELDREMVPY